MIKITDRAADKLKEAMGGADSGQKSIRVFFNGFG
jgi:Fe-S cluster assembly iron-binding protein IscA